MRALNGRHEPAPYDPGDRENRITLTPVEEAQTTLQFTPKMGARIVQKVLKSAVANALHEGKVRVEDLYVKEAVVGAGPTLKRWLPRAQGRATPLLKRTSHVSVTVATRES